MNTSQKQYNAVVEFMNMGGQEVNTGNPTFQTLGLSNLRINLVKEEIFGKNEMFDSASRDDFVGVLDGMCDVLYVALGAAATFGVDVGNVDYAYVQASDVFVGKALVAHRTLAHQRIINDSYEQFVRGVEQGNLVVVQKALTHLIHNVYDYAKSSGFQLEAAFDEVHSSNMSKFCKSEIDAYDSITQRISDGKVADYSGATISEKNGLYIIKRQSDGKILKGSDFFEPDLSKFVPTYTK